MPVRPLLVFPTAVAVAPAPGRSFPPGTYHYPTRDRQDQRINEQLQNLSEQFREDQARLSQNALGLEPELVLVIETIGNIDDFKRAVIAAGLEFLDEWDTEDNEPDEDFFKPGKEDQITDKRLDGRIFLTMSNQQSLNQVLVLWNKWKTNGTFPSGQTKWKNVFSQLKTIRRWNVQDRFAETGLIEIWREDLANATEAFFPCHIELWYRTNPAKRAQVEASLRALITDAGGRLLVEPLVIPEIHLHAIKAELPRNTVEALVNNLDDNGIELFQNSNVMFCRPTGQCIVTIDTENDAPFSISPHDLPTGSPVAAIFDGLPMANHDLLRDRLIIDDADDLASQYQPLERRHGTAMASLVVHGELHSGSTALRTPVYCRPVMRPVRGAGYSAEFIPENVFFEDLIHRAVRRMFEGEGNTPPQAPSVKVINLSIGDPARPFVNIPSPWARLLDWLSWKYNVLFCVSAGNYVDPIELAHNEASFRALNNNDRVRHTFQQLHNVLADRRILSPAESINSITVGAQHIDASANGPNTSLIDLMPDTNLPSPISRSGHGFRRAVKPEILMPGGRRMYRPPLTTPHAYTVSSAVRFVPGQLVATDGAAGQLAQTTITSGTSNAAAIATRSAVLIHEMIEELRAGNINSPIQDAHVAVIMKALLVHGATWNGAGNVIIDALRSIPASELPKRRAARVLGYGFSDITKVLECTAQRATVIGCGTIRSGQKHEYRFPLPPALSGSNERRRLVITLAWFSPINPAHRHLRQASLFFEPPSKDALLPMGRQEADWQQVKKGTIQHEILEGADVSAFEDGSDLIIPITCKSDAGDLTQPISYGLAVTMQVAEGVGIPIYDQVRDRISLQIRATT